MQTIRQLRRDHGWTQFELALLVGVQPQTVYLWESGRRTPQVPPLRKLGQLFGLCSDAIILEPVNDPLPAPPHRAHADRRPGESVPGRSPNGRVVTRSQDAAADSGDGP
jgi:DNA-binding XRE family transcriptional regulator